MINNLMPNIMPEIMFFRQYHLFKRYLIRFKCQDNQIDSSQLEQDANLSLANSTQLDIKKQYDLRYQYAQRDLRYSTQGDLRLGCFSECYYLM